MRPPRVRRPTTTDVLRVLIVVRDVDHLADRQKLLNLWVFFGHQRDLGHFHSLYRPEASHPGDRAVHIIDDSGEHCDPIPVIASAIELFLCLPPEYPLCQSTVERLDESLRAMVTGFCAAHTNTVF